MDNFDLHIALLQEKCQGSRDWQGLADTKWGQVKQALHNTPSGASLLAQVKSSMEPLLARFASKLAPIQLLPLIGLHAQSGFDFKNRGPGDYPPGGCGQSPRF